MSQRGRLPSSASLATTIRSLATHADIAGTAEADFVRAGCNKLGSSLFLDLGDSTWRAIEIQATGWHVVNRPGVHFRRAAGQRALPEPARDGSIGLLRKYVNVEPADMPLLIGWLTAALRPAGPHPILVINGEQGSAKSRLARICKLLVDPHSTPLRAEPKDHRDLMGGGAARLGSRVRQFERHARLALERSVPAGDRRRHLDPWAIHQP